MRLFVRLRQLVVRSGNQHGRFAVVLLESKNAVLSMVGCSEREGSQVARNSGNHLLPHKVSRSPSVTSLTRTKNFIKGVIGRVRTKSMPGGILSPYRASFNRGYFPVNTKPEVLGKVRCGINTYRTLHHGSVRTRYRYPTLW